MESPLDVLSLEADADEEGIEEAYRERVKEAHPDHGGSLEEFLAVRAAYERLIAGEWDEPETSDWKTGDRRSAEWPGSQSPSETEFDEYDRHGRPYSTASATVTYLNYDVIADFGWDIDDDQLFEKAAAADLESEDFGQFETELGESVLEAAERSGFAWPFACRGGACANCAIKLCDGELSMPVSHVLPLELMEQGIRLSCNGIPITDELEVVYNVKHMPELDDLLLPPRPFIQAHLDD